MLVSGEYEGRSEWGNSSYRLRIPQFKPSAFKHHLSTIPTSRKHCQDSIEIGGHKSIPYLNYSLFLQNLVLSLSKGKRVLNVFAKIFIGLI